MTERFYVYSHARQGSGEVFYIGKGTWTEKRGFARAYEQNSRNRNLHWRRIVAKHGSPVVEVLAVTLTEAVAFALERAFIGLHGRRVDGGTLCNMTLGGEGHSGWSPDAETRARLSASASGERHPNWGKRLSSETCRRKSESMKASPKSLRGKKLPLWWREKIRQAKYGALNPMYGKPSSRRKAVALSDGAVYPSITAAAQVAGLSIQGLSNMLTGFRPNTIGARYA